jgi:hypothetical protein
LFCGLISFFLCEAFWVLVFGFDFGLVWGWFGLLVLALASAIFFRDSCVAPVRGGTYFLCRRKESRQRKRAHTANP